MLIDPKRLKILTSNLMCMFLGTVRIWSLKCFYKGGVDRVTWPLEFLKSLDGYMHSHEHLLVFALQSHSPGCCVCADELWTFEALHWERTCAANVTASLWQHAETRPFSSHPEIYQCVEWTTQRDNHWVRRQYAQVQRYIKPKLLLCHFVCKLRLVLQNL